MLDAERGTTLIRLARAAIAAQFDVPLPDAADETWLIEPGACFVTLTLNGELRGCVGSLAAHRPLMQDVRANAVAAAFRDTRFAPLQVMEFADTAVEVSLLSPMKALVFDSEQGALAQLRPGVDGVVFEYKHYRSTFLPQVWEQLKTPEVFMTQLKRKAGLPGDFWEVEVRLSCYTVEKWKEFQ
jgi:AmmeMemoRadiSam system protein A